MIRLVIDSQAVTPRRSGIGEEVRRIVLALLEHYSDEVQLFLYNGRDIFPARTPEEAGSVWETTGGTQMYDAMHQFRLPFLLSKRKYDVFLTPDAIPPFLNLRVPMVAIINDATPFAIPEYFTGTKKGRLLPVFRFIARMTVARCRKIIVISRHTERDVIRFFRCPRHKIVLAYLGGMEMDGERHPPALDIEAGGYLLYVGRRELYKGIDHALRAFEAARRESERKVKFVFVGEPDARYEGYYASIIGGMEHGRDVVNAGYLPDDQLAWLYDHALALVHPSMYEGFGLPPLYAMSRAIPVVSSNRASLPEIVGEAGLLIDPADTRAFADALLRIFHDDALRRDLASKGRQQAANFDWKKTAGKILEAVSSAATS
jgi:glycosyltransferase involved in cell wall biosynthesis